MALFLTKKQKAQMKERRKKKKLAHGDTKPAHKNETTTDEPLFEPAERVPQSTPEKEEGDAARPNLKRPREESTSSAVATADKRKRLSLQTKQVDGKLLVVIPKSIGTKDIKKFRKDARRQLRQEGKDDSNLEFVDEDELPPGFLKPKKKKDFPSIKELLQQKQHLQKAQKEEQKFKEKIHQIPEEVKSQYVALDCEMVGIGSGGKKSALARVSIVDWNLNVILDSFVKVPIRVTDFRTHVSGVEPKHIKDKNAMTVEECRNRVAEIIKDKILVGHALSNDFKALMLNHPKMKIRDTAKFKPFQRYANGKWRPRKLRDLVKENLKNKEGFQEGEHDSVQDARATMELFQVVRPQWEKELGHKK